MFRNVLSAAACLTILAAPAMAAAPAVSKDPKAVVSGTYNLDPRHASVIARVGHGGGTSYSVFRFDTISGSLTVDAANPSASKVTVNVDPKSITSNVAGFGEELGTKDTWLNASKFPQATFTSTNISANGGKATVTGNLTLAGQTKPITANVELVGSGKTMQGKAAVGFTGTAKFKRSDFGVNAMVGPVGDEVELLIDIEFAQP